MSRVDGRDGLDCGYGCGVARAVMDAYAGQDVRDFKCTTSYDSDVEGDDSASV